MPRCSGHEGDPPASAIPASNRQWMACPADEAFRRPTSAATTEVTSPQVLTIWHLVQIGAWAKITDSHETLSYRSVEIRWRSHVHVTHCTMQWEGEGLSPKHWQ